MQDFSSLPLRDIHLPVNPGWWPPAPGWWMLAGFLMLLAFALWYWRRARRRARVRRAARAALKQLEASFRRDADAQRLASELSSLLRRVCISLDSREQVAGLTGRAWLERLDRLSPTAHLGQGPSGRALLAAPYQAGATFDSDALLQACHRWVDGLPEVAS